MVVKAAQLMVQNVDIEPAIGQDNLDRIIEVEGEEIEGADLELKELITPALCYYTYSRLLLNFQGTYTDSGFTNDQLAAAITEAKSVSNQMRGVADTSMKKVIAFLKEEDPQTEADDEKLVPGVRVFGGKEIRASN